MKKPKIIKDLKHFNESMRSWKQNQGVMTRDIAYTKVDPFEKDWSAKLGAGIFLTLSGFGGLYAGFWLALDSTELAIFFRVAGLMALTLGLPLIVFQAIKIGRWKTDPIIKVASYTHWRNDYPWPKDHIKGIKVQELNKYIWGFVIFIAFMIGWTAVNIYGDASTIMTILTGLMWIIGVFFFIDLVKRSRRHLKYGTSKLYPPQMPILQGALQPLIFENKRVAVRHETLNFNLRLIQEKVLVENNSEGEYSERITFLILHEKTYVAKINNQQFTVNIEIPIDSPPNKLNVDPVAYWVLDVQGAEDFETSFILPVYNETRMT